jgi:hypothetical protein
MASWKQFASSPIRERERLSVPSVHDGSLDSAALRQIHEQVAGLESGLYEEIERRMSSEDHIREQVEGKIKVAINRLADVTETEMAKMYRRIEADLADRLDKMSRELVSVSSSVRKLTNQVELITVESRSTRVALSQLERRLSGSGPSGDSDDIILKTGKNEMEKLKSLIESDLETSKKLEQIDQEIQKRVYPRLETVEDWLRTNLTPEILRLKEKISLEALTREDNDKNILELVTQYTSVVQSHFESKPSTKPTAMPALATSRQKIASPLPSLQPLPVARQTPPPSGTASQSSTPSQGRAMLTKIFDDQN